MLRDSGRIDARAVGFRYLYADEVIHARRNARETLISPNYLRNPIAGSSNKPA